jgi:hypothetical protein
LNYLIIFVKNFERFPTSKFELLDKLIQDYFNEHISNNEIILPVEFDISKKIISSIAFNVIFKLKTRQLTKIEYKILLKEITDNLRERAELDNSITDEFLTNFFLSYNILNLENKILSFWHSILLEYFCAIELAYHINNNILIIPFEEISKLLNFKNILITCFPLIENENFKETLKNSNIFLYLESLFEKSDLTEAERQFILNVFYGKLDSEYRFIQETVCRLFEKFLKYSEHPEEILENILTDNENPNVIKWALLELGKLKSQSAMEFLLEINYDLRTERDFYIKPLNGYKLIALSNFGNKEVQDYIINEIKREWAGIPYLEMIGTALFNIAKRKELSSISFRKILNLYETPPNLDTELDSNSIKINIRYALEKLIIECNNINVIPLLLEILKKEQTSFRDFNTINIVSNIIKESHIPLIITLIKNDSYTLEFRNSLAYILFNSDLVMDFDSMFGILEYVINKGFIPDQSDLNLLSEEYNEYIIRHPEFEYYKVFGTIVECFTKESRIKNFTNKNIQKLIKLLKPYIDYHNDYVQENVIEIVGKYNPELLLEKTSFFRRSFLKYLESIFNLDENRAIEKIKKFSKSFFTEPNEFFNYMLFASVIQLLLKNDFIEISEELFDEYITTEIDYQNLNLSSFRFISDFSKDYAIKILNHFKEKFLQFEDNKFSRLHQLTFFVPAIEDDRYIEFCMEIAKIFPRELDFSFSKIFYHLIPLNPIKYEKDFLTIFQEKINEGYRIYGALNILAFIGTDQSVDFLSQYLENTDDILKQKAFYCIRRIKERENIDWYNEEELFNE